MPLYKRPGNHWKRSPRFERRESEQEEEESQPLRRTGASRSLKDIMGQPRGQAVGIEHYRHHALGELDPLAKEE
jgi:hypothetical protein